MTFVVFRAKKLPQDTNMVPRAGIYLLKDDVEYLPIGAADFRTYDIPFDPILKSVEKMTSGLLLEKKKSVHRSWDRLRDRLENTARRQEYLPKMDITKLPKNTAYNIPPLADSLTETIDELVIRGNVLDEAVEEGSMEEIAPGDDVFVYAELSKRKKGPWGGDNWANKKRRF